MNDLVKFIKNLNITLYADDTAFFLASNNITFLTTELSKAASKFKNWCDLNKLTLNLNKSKVLLISGSTAKKIKQIKETVVVTINNEPLELVSEYKYLGIVLDERLNFHSHLDSIRKRISQRLYLLKKIRWVINYKDALLLYKSSILPYFDLGSLFYVCCNHDKLNSLQKL